MPLPQCCYRTYDQKLYKLCRLLGTATLGILPSRAKLCKLLGQVTCSRLWLKTLQIVKLCKFSGLEQVTLPSNLQNLVFGFWFDQSLAGLLCQSFCKALNSVTCSIRALVGWRCEVVCRLWFLAIALTKASMKHDENTKQRKKWLTIYVTSIHCQYTSWWNFHVNGSEFSPINKIEQGSLATTSMITTATKLMAHFMLDCSSKEVSPSHSKSSAPANASINASVTTKNSLRSACMARLLKSTTNVWIYSSKTNKVNS